jgi:SagB-type dehydrogenase family enzyme
VNDDIGRRYLRETRHLRTHLVGGRMDWTRQPEWFKTYPDAPRVALPDPPPVPPSGASVTPPPERPPATGLFEAMARRRSVREYGPPPLRLDELSALLWAAAGVTAEDFGFAFRTAPSAGGLFPIETYVVAHAVDGLDPGVYHYAVLDRILELLRGGDFRRPVALAALDQPIAASADAVFVWTAVLERSSWKYGERFLRYVLLDAGHIAENVALAAVALGLGSCQIAAFYDDEAAALLGVDAEREPVVYMTTLGRPV